MINIASEITQQLNESKFLHHLFNDEKMTFRHLRDTLADVFNDNIIKISKKTPTVDLYLTKSNGNWFVSSYVRPSKQLQINRSTTLNEVDSADRDVVSNTLADITKACDDFDDVFLNKCFANGKNRACISLVCPPDGCGDSYNNKCFLLFKGIDCFDDKCKKVGSDEDLGVKLLFKLNNSPSLLTEMALIPLDKISCLRKCKNEKDIMSDINKSLDKLIDGIGWGCSLKYYIEDKCSRHIVNKALKHGLDISKNGQLVNELVSRMSSLSLRPTKSDLVTFAKREGVDYKSDAYKAFLDDIENSSSGIVKQVISPIEKMIYYAISCVVKNLVAMMQLDPNPLAKKILNAIALDLFNGNDIEADIFDISNIKQLKKMLAKVCAYKDIAPAEIRILHNNKPYSITCDCNKLLKLCDII